MSLLAFVAVHYAAAAPAVDRSPPCWGPAANPPQWQAAGDRWDREMNGWTPDITWTLYHILSEQCQNTEMSAAITFIDDGRHVGVESGGGNSFRDVCFLSNDLQQNLH